MRNLIIGIVVVVILVLGGFLLLGGNKNTTSKSTQQTSNSNSNPTQSNSNSTTPQDNVTITYTDNGFSPDSATMKSGGTITWVNNSSSQMQIGVNPHPVHTGDRSITNGEFTLSLNAGESKQVTVSKTGTFGYHNHLDPLKTGTITVQ